MSSVSEGITASIVLADFVNVDAGGKANIIGAGLRVLPVDPNTNVTPPFGLLVLLSSPISSGDEGPAFEIVLCTADGQLVEMAGPAGSQAVRFSQNIDFSEPGALGVVLPRGTLPSTVQIAVNFGGGLPLQVGNSYQFRAQVDQDIVATYSFYVPRPKPGAVIG
jgi:hypothetical protein